MPRDDGDCDLERGIDGRRQFLALGWEPGDAVETEIALAYSNSYRERHHFLLTLWPHSEKTKYAGDLDVTHHPPHLRLIHPGGGT